MKVVDEERITLMEGAWTPAGMIRDVVEGGAQEEPFYVMDVGEVVARYQRWKELMPRVEPFYAVKCNDSKVLLSVLAALGANFDCASKGEMELVTSLGIDPERIIFANPAKMASHIRYASSVGVNVMTFDSETELMKVKQYMPHAQLVIRIRYDAENAQCPLGIKFGCDPVTEAPRLLKLAAVLGLEVVGVSFHVGSGARDVGVWSRAVPVCRALMSLARSLGHARVTLLDLGGGYPGEHHTDLYEAAQVINAALEEHFPARSGVRVIAEPGRYFAAAAYTLAACVYAKRDIPLKGDSEYDTSTMYFINDGVYGSFNCIMYDHQKVVGVPLNSSSEAPRPSSVWGPTCDGLDCVLRDVRLPPLRLGDWLVFRDMGAYTLPVASTFNGFPKPRVRHYVDKELWLSLKDKWPLSTANFQVGEVPLSPACRNSAPLPASHNMGGVFVECALK